MYRVNMCMHRYRLQLVLRKVYWPPPWLKAPPPHTHTHTHTAPPPLAYCPPIHPHKHCSPPCPLPALIVCSSTQVDDFEAQQLTLSLYNDDVGWADPVLCEGEQLFGYYEEMVVEEEGGRTVVKDMFDLADFMKVGRGGLGGR